MKLSYPFYELLEEKLEKNPSKLILPLFKKQAYATVCISKQLYILNKICLCGFKPLVRYFSETTSTGKEWSIILDQLYEGYSNHDLRKIYSKCMNLLRIIQSRYIHYLEKINDEVEIATSNNEGSLDIELLIHQQIAKQKLNKKEWLRTFICSIYDHMCHNKRYDTNIRINYIYVTKEEYHLMIGCIGFFYPMLNFKLTEYETQMIRSIFESYL